MKTSAQYKKSVMKYKPNSFFAFCLISLSHLLFSHDILAWSGYDYENGATIDIGPGNLVREGNIIRFYDWNKDEDHNARVESIDSSFNATRVEIYDLDEKRYRIFEMEAD